MTKSQSLRFMGGRFLAALGDQFLMFAAPLIVFHATGSVSKSGIAFLVEWLPRISCLPFAGYFADKIDNRKLYLIADGSRALICIASFALIATHAVDAFVVVTVQMGLMAVFNSLAFITIEATVPRLFKPSELPKAQSALQAMDQLSQVLGPALAAASLALVQTETLIIVPTLGFFISCLNVALLSPMIVEGASTAKTSLVSIVRTLRFGFQLLLSRQELLMLSFLSCMVNFVMGLSMAQAVPLIVGTFGKTEQFFGSVTTIAALLSIVTFTQIPRLAKKVSITTLGTLALVGLFLAGFLISTAPNAATFTAGYALLTASCAVFNIFMRTWRAQIIPREHLGKVIGVLVLVNNSTLPLSGAFVAAFALKMGSQSMILCASVLLTLSTVFYLWWIRSARFELAQQGNSL